VFVFFLGGPVADKITMWISKRRGSREPEYQLANLVLPITLAIIGALLFGYANQNNLHFKILLTGSFLLMSATLISAPIINNFCIESYPQWAGCVLYSHQD
jgi:hypothetical protein